MIGYWSRFLILFVLYLHVSTSENVDTELVLTVSRNLNKLGFHRELVYSFELITNGIYGGCQLCFAEEIPQGLFFNKNQIEEFGRFGKIVAFINGSDDIERPQMESEPQTIRVYVNLTQSHSILSGSVNLPLHARYHEPQPGGGFKKAIIGPPLLYISCHVSPIFGDWNTSVVFPCSPDDPNPCVFYPLTYNINVEYLDVEIPVGNTNHYNLVYLLTLAVTSVGTIYILVVILNNKPSN